MVTADCLDVLPTLPDGCVDAVVTDPPYGTGQWQRQQSGCGGNPSAVFAREAWDQWDTRWLDAAEVVGVNRIGMFCAPANLPSVYEWAGEKHTRLGFWNKSDPRPRFAGQPAFAFECFIAIGGVEPCGGIDVVTASSPRENRDHDATGHPHQKPIRAVRWGLRWVASSGGVILDPFCGSGTTGVAALCEGCRFIGIELDPKYADIARRRIAAEEAHPMLIQPGAVVHKQGMLLEGP